MFFSLKTFTHNMLIDFNSWANKTKSNCLKMMDMMGFMFEPLENVKESALRCAQRVPSRMLSNYEFRLYVFSCLSGYQSLTASCTNVHHWSNTVQSEEKISDQRS